MKLDRSVRVLAALLALSLAAPAAAQIGDSEFRVNTTSPTKQRESAVAFSPAGDVIFVWRDLRAGLTARFFPANGRPSGDVVLVDNLIFDNNPGQGTIYSRIQPVPVYLADGSFLLFWTEEKGYLRAAVFHYEYDVLEQDIFAQRFSPEGRPVSRRFRVHRGQQGLQRNPSVAIGRDGAFLIAWESSDGVAGVGAGDGVFARAFDANGLTTAGEVKVDDAAGISARLPAVASGRDGGFLAVWEGEGDGTDGIEAFGRLLGPAGQPVGPQLRLNTTLQYDQSAPAVAAGADGNYLTVWFSRVEAPGVPGIYRVFGQAVSPEGALLGPELAIGHNDVERAHARPKVAASPRGEYLVGWLMWLGDFQTAVDGIHLDGLGNPLGEPFRISEHQPSSRTIDMAAGPRGDFLVTWEGFTDDETLGIAARRVPGSLPEEPQTLPAVPQVRAVVAH